ncbi:MAG: hypothetical protein KA098_05860, partial [Phenylobacterium sp.]|nr:hypothetical protein [Phenylobacterium sp.]
NDVKDRDRLRRPHCLAPVVGGGGYLRDRPVPVNQTFQSFFENFEINSKPSKWSTPRPFRRLQTQENQGLPKFVPAASPSREAAI